MGSRRARQPGSGLPRWRRGRPASTRSRRVFPIVAGSLAACALGAAAWAYFTAGGNGNANGTVTTLSPPTNLTAPSQTGSPVAVTWTATSAPASAGGGNVDGYYVQRYVGSTPANACGTSSSSLLAGSATSCDDTVATAGTYTYRVTAVWRSWTAQSAESESVVVAVVGAPSPTSGIVGSSVTITGSGFDASTALSVTVGGTSATITAGGSSNASGNVNVTFTVPAKVAGSYSVVVSDGTRAAASATSFTITRSISVSPTSGAVSSSVTISGSAFPASSSVSATFDGSAVTLTPATSTNGVGSFSGASFTVPTSAAGAHTVQATAGSQSASATYTVVASMSLSPTSGNAGTPVTVSGAGFGASKTLSATFDGSALTLSPASPQTDSSGSVPGDVTFTVPGSTSGSHTVTVTDNAGTPNSASASFTVTFPACTSSTSTADYLSVATGGWSSTSTWYSCSNSGSWGAAGHSPTSADGSVKVQTANTVTVAAGVTVDQVTVKAGGDLEVASGVTLTVADSSTSTIDLTISGSVGVSGTLTLQTGSTGGDLEVMSGGALTVNAGGLMNGSGGGAGTTSQVTVDSGGSFTINSGGSLSAGGSTGMQLTINSGGTATWNGTVTMGTSLTANGTVTASANITMGSISNLQIGGTLTMTAGTLQTNRGNGGTMGQINSGGSLVLQNSSIFSLSGVSTSSYTVASGGTLDMGPSALVNGGGLLSVASGASLKIGSADGIASSTSIGNVRTSGTDTYSTGASYTYNGTAAQVTGAGLPSTVNALTTNNSAGVSLTSSITLTNGGTVTSGTFTIGANNVTTPGSSTLVMGANTLSRTTGYVIGGLQKNVATGSNVSPTFEVGTSTAYIPVSLTLTQVTTGGNLTVRATAAAHPNLSSWTPAGANKVNAYWTFTNSGIVLSSPNTYGATFQWDASLEDAGFVVSSAKTGQYNSSWSYPTVGTPNAGPPRTITASSLTNLNGDFQIGN